MLDLRSKKNLALNAKKPVFFYILIRSWNTFEYFDTCVNSVLKQNYHQFQILFIDDCSNYNLVQRKFIRKKLEGHIVVFNKKRKYSIRNAYDAIHKYASDPEAVVVSLDGDDWLIDKDALTYLNMVYQSKNCFFTYGNCLVWDGKEYHSADTFDPLANQKYPASVFKQNSFRTEPFRPLHLRTWKVWLYKKISKQDFCTTPNIWLRFCEDMAIFFPFLEMYGQHCFVSTKPLVVYNQGTPQNDIKMNTSQTIKEEIIIRKKRAYHVQE